MTEFYGVPAYNPIRNQTPEPGALVFVNSKIEIIICRGQPFQNPFFGYTEGQIHKSGKN